MAKQIHVTKDSLQALLNRNDPVFVMHVVGRALLVLLDNQTESEQRSERTTELNGEGFTGTEGEFGASTAKQYKRNKRLSPRQVACWTKKNSKGYSKIAKYHRQMDAAVEAKQQAVMDRLAGVA